MEMESLVRKLLGPPEEVETVACFPAYLHRWMIFGTKHFKVYLHHSYNEDLTVNLCDYPERFISFGFVNSYEDSAGTLAFSDRAAWMVLIAKLSRGRQKRARD